MFNYNNIQGEGGAVYRYFRFCVRIRFRFRVSFRFVSIVSVRV